ncbi:hypothetical protein [Aquabacterium sp.]|uniref:hypothetical protein n=1 Tax=Aquabacterium sp. TaxID=1872578 RepID=UPI003783B183
MMQATRRIEVPQRLEVLVLLAQLFEQLDRAGQVAADQYRSVAQRLAAELQAVPVDDHLKGLLGVFPAMAQLYENLNYAQAGLVRSPLEAAAEAELQARALLGRLAPARKA